MKKVNLKKKVYDDVLQSIVRGEYSADDIISEGMLIEKYNVSKSPVREALVQLCSENVLKSIPRCGYMVVKLTESDINDILNFRMAFESGMLTQIIDNISEDQLKELRDRRYVHGEEAVKDFWLHWEYNKRFHLRLMSFTNNRFAYLSLEHASEHSDQSLRSVLLEPVAGHFFSVGYEVPQRYHSRHRRKGCKKLFTSMPTCRISAESSICQSYSQEGCL